jgi:hypothetical protein
MATYLADKCAEIRRWLAIGSDVYPDDVISSWIRMAEEQLSFELRVKHMIQIDTSNLTAERVPLPLDWQEIRLARLVGETGVLRYNTPDDFFNPEFPDAPASPYKGKQKRYTILGNFLIVGGTTITPGLQVELTYYQNIPPLSDANNNWINYYHPSVFTLKILHIASMYAIEDDRGPMWQQQVIALISEMNIRHAIDKASGSTLQPVRRKTFG